MNNSEMQLVAMLRRWDHECAYLVEYVLFEKRWNLDNMESAYKGMREKVKPIMEEIDLSEVDPSILVSMGFESYNADSSLMLLPYWFWYLMPDDARVVTLDTKESIQRKNCNLPDIRNGCVRYALNIEHREE